jgi:hypothetical protein
MFSKGWTRKAFGQRIGHILRSCAFQQLDVVVVVAWGREAYPHNGYTSSGDKEIENRDEERKPLF